MKNIKEVCCKLNPQQGYGSTSCPHCGQPGKVVKRITLGALLRPVARLRIPRGDTFWFCPVASCDVVYFRSGEALFRKEDLRVSVYQKEQENPSVPVCYCFEWTPSAILDEIKAKGRSTVMDKIKSQLKSGNCYCEVTNPQGSCCLGNVAAFLKGVSRSTAAT